jgi:acetylornithine deacetylase
VTGRGADSLLRVFSDDEIVALEKQLIEIRSDPLDETPLARFIAGFLQAEGIEAALQAVTVPAAFAGTGKDVISHNVVARLPGAGGGASLMFNGHIDVNPTDLAVGGTAATGFRNWIRDPFKASVEDGRVYGKGAYDEKGGVCAMLATAVSLKRAGAALGGDVYFCPVMGHYTESVGTKSVLKSGATARYGICTENSDSWIVPSHNGGVAAEVRVRGVNPGTKYSLPETFDRATGFENAVRFIQALGREGVPHPDEGWTSFARHPEMPEFPNHRIGTVRPVDRALDHIAIGFVVKTVPGVDDRSVVSDLKRLLASLEARYDDFHAGEVTCRVTSPPLVTPRTSPVVRALARAHETVTGRPATVGTRSRLGAMGDSGVMGAAGIETVVFGPGVMHDVDQLRGLAPQDESISIAELVASARIMTLAAAELCGGG